MAVINLPNIAQHYFLSARKRSWKFLSLPEPYEPETTSLIMDAFATLVSL